MCQREVGQESKRGGELQTKAKDNKKGFQRREIGITKQGSEGRKCLWEGIISKAQAICCWYLARRSLTLDGPFGLDRSFSETAGREDGLEGERDEMGFDDRP